MPGERPTVEVLGGVRALAVRAVVALAVLLLAGCADDERPPAQSPPSGPASPSISTLSPLPMPDMGPPEGELVADLRQSSRDAAAGRFQVWIGNGLARDVDPTSILYADPRFRAPVPGERLRPNPSGAERGYPLALPPRPDCSAPRRAAGTVTLRFDGRSVALRVEDEADVVSRYVASRCFELAVNKVARLSFEDEVAVDGTGEGSVGTLVLVATPSGRPGGELTVDTVSGTPVLTAAGRSSWRPEVTVRSGDPGSPVRIELPVVPARCDGHAFLESGGATAFRVGLHLDGVPGELVVRMSPAGASAAIGFALESCGLG